PARAPVGVSEPVHARMRFEGEMHLSDCNTIVSFLLSPSGLSTNQGFIVRPTKVKGCKRPKTMYLPFDPLPPGKVANLRRVFLEKHNVFDFELDDQRTNPAPLPAGEWVTFALDTIQAGVLVLEINGKEAARQDVPISDSEVRPGLLLYGGTVKLRNLRVTELDKP
ncbi:MAG: hypothetical protein ABGY29_17265, partial [bacterium]